MRSSRSFLFSWLGILLSMAVAVAQPAEHSGIYPHLAMFNQNGECGVGGVVPWGDRLWVITYSPHFPFGSDDKLYEITPDLKQIIRPESIGGTPASRMVHSESDQLFIGPYAIRKDGSVRAIQYSRMPGRHTGNARHLFEPEKKIYFATMEEGFYEVDVETLEVKELFADNQKQTGHGASRTPKDFKHPAEERYANLPGYHGKGLYSGQGVLVYANNGEPSQEARRRPDIPSGALAEWNGKTRRWNVVRRSQFTEVSGPGSLAGNPDPSSDPIWSVGWDTKSILLAVRMPESGWTFYRLPKASHSYDGAHGWNTEWPRIRDIGEENMLMTMHGTFWALPKTFAPSNSAGITPRSNYLKVIGDFCRWGDRLVFGCDDVAKREFMNRRNAKGKIKPAQSQSNLWFADPAILDQLGPPIGRGLVWEREDVSAEAPSDPFLFSGYDMRGLHLAHQTGATVTVTIEVDGGGNGTWTSLRQVEVDEYTFVAFEQDDVGAWVRLRCNPDAKAMTAAFTYRRKERRSARSAPMFEGIARSGQKLTGGLVRARNGNKKTLSLLAKSMDRSVLGYYELDGELNLKRVDDDDLTTWTEQNAAIPRDAISLDDASVIFTDDKGNRWRLPRGDRALDAHPLGPYRVDREIVTERDLFNAHGTFYELPSPNSGGFIKVRPVATHNRLIHDYCGYRGLLIMSGIAVDAPDDNRHIIRSDDGKTAVWAGTIDDVWKLGKPRGMGGPWKDMAVKAGQPSDPYLMTAYDRKTVRISHRSSDAVTIALQVDIDGNGLWVQYQEIECPANETVAHEFPEAFSAYWIRAVSDKDATVTVQLDYR